MNQLPLSEVFVYRGQQKFFLDMFPPTSATIRERWKNCHNDVKPEPMSCIHNVYEKQESGLINVHDAYIAFKAAFGTNDHEKDKQTSNCNGKGTNKETNVEKVISDEEKLYQIQFRMSVNDLRFCGFTNVTNKTKELGFVIKMPELL